MTTEIHEAIRTGGISQIRQLINPASVKQIEISSGLLPIFTAAKCGNLEALKLLLQYSTLREKTEDGYTLMHFAAYSGNIAIIGFLKSQGLLYSEKTIDGLTPMHCASAGGQISTMRYLNLEGNVPYNIRSCRGETPMHSAAYKGQIGTMKFLHEQGISYDVKSNTGLTPMDKAVANNQIDAMKYPYNTGKIDYNVINNNGSAAIHAVDVRNQIIPMDTLNKRSVRYDMRSNKGTPIHLAPFGGHPLTLGHLHTVGQLPDDSVAYNEATPRDLASAPAKTSLIAGLEKTAPAFPRYTPRTPSSSNYILTLRETISVKDDQIEQLKNKIYQLEAQNQELINLLKDKEYLKNSVALLKQKVNEFGNQESKLLKRTFTQATNGPFPHSIEIPQRPANKLNLPSFFTTRPVDKVNSLGTENVTVDLHKVNLHKIDKT